MGRYKGEPHHNSNYHEILTMLTLEQQRALQAIAWRDARKRNPKAHTVWAAVKRRQEKE